MTLLNPIREGLSGFEALACSRFGACGLHGGIWKRLHDLKIRGACCMLEDRKLTARATTNLVTHAPPPFRKNREHQAAHPATPNPESFAVL